MYAIDESIPDVMVAKFSAVLIVAIPLINRNITD